MTVEEELYKVHTHMEDDTLEMFISFDDAVRIAKQYAAQESELSWDAATDYARECADWSVSKNALVDRETYLKKYNV